MSRTLSLVVMVGLCLCALPAAAQDAAAQDATAKAPAQDAPTASTDTADAPAAPQPVPSTWPVTGASAAGWLLLGSVPTAFTIFGGGLVAWFAVQLATTPPNDNPNSHRGMGVGLSMSLTGGALALMVPLSISGAAAGAATWGALTSEKDRMVRWAPTVGAIAGGVSCVLLAGSLTALGGVLLGIPSTPTAYVGTGVLVGAFATVVAVGPASVGGAALFHHFAASNVDREPPPRSRFNTVPERDVE